MRPLIFSIFILTFFFHSCKTSLEKIKSDNEPLLGSWQLFADEQIDSSGRVILQDTNVSGLLIYTLEEK